MYNDSNNNIDIKKRDKIRYVKYSAMTILAAIVSSLALHVFVYPASFVPLGLEAVVTMLQSIFEVNAGYFNLLLNLPLVIYAFIKLDKRYIIFTLAFTVLSSLFLILFEELNIPQYKVPVYKTVDGVEKTVDRLLCAIFAGILLGVRTGLMLKINSSTGGVDIIARIIQKGMPHVNIERIISLLCLVLIGVSYFVYNDFECILLGIVQMFISERATTYLMKDNREAVEIKIITKHPEEVRQDIIVNLRHSATVIESKGLYSGEPNTLLLCVLNLYQMSNFIQIMKKHPDTFVYYGEVSGVYGNFRRYKDEVVK